MKKILYSAGLLLFLTSCGGAGSESVGTASASAGNSNPDYQKGLSLVSKSNCFTCHKIDDKLVGPTYRDIANKYASQSDAVAVLGQKIIKGGSGVWGNVPMLPHPELSIEEAESMAKYILLLKK